MLSPNIILRERYRIIQQLGQGGVGAVYPMMDESVSCLVAIKGTFATTDEQRRAFRRETQLLAKLNHPTLPRVIDHFAGCEGQFFVRPFVPGHDLVELVERKESLTAHLNAVAQASPTALLHNSNLGLNLSTFL